jgi:uncharacterized protein YraI
MKRISAPCAAVILAGMFLSACNLPSQPQGPSTWIDQPLDGVQVPLAPLTIQAHASDADGVDAIEFYVADSLVASVPAGGVRLGEALIQWTPPAAGVYVISASAVDSQGNIGPRASVQVSVGDITTTDTPTVAPASLQCAPDALAAPALVSPADGSSVASDPLLAWSYPDATCHPYSYKIDVSEDASFSDVGWGFGTLDYNETSRQWPLPPGKCYYWRAMSYVPDVTGPASPTWRFCIAGTAGPSFTLAQNAHCRLGPGTAYDSVDVLNQGTTVAIEGRNDDSSWFWVLKPSGSSHCWVAASVGTASGEWQTVPIVAAPPLPTQPPTVAVDSTPPSITNYSVNPSSIQQGGCGQPSTAVVSATVSDAGGVSRVIARIPGVGEVEMTHVGGGVFQATVGPFSSTGEISIFIFAWDNAGNGAQSAPLTITVVCIG